MASTGIIYQLASHLTAKLLRDSNMIDLPTEVEVLFTAVKQTTCMHQKFFAGVHEER
ncbi:hypothetical protein F5146DRAFT_1135755 [Armillaria mellea]|nr:hypothetical protein F5146DRAFT_1135755 [Armillaria mellea]